jgi:hypothetical protein
MMIVHEMPLALPCDRWGGAFRKQDLVPGRENRDVGQETVSVPGAALWTDTTGQGPRPSCSVMVVLG